MMDRLISFFKNRRAEQAHPTYVPYERRKPRTSDMDKRLHDAIDTFSKTIVRHRDNLDR